MKIQQNTWYRIPRFNGYEIILTKTAMHQRSRMFEDESSFFTLRSWKNFKRYPLGYILPYDHRKDQSSSWVARNDGYFELTDISNIRIRVKIQQVMALLNHEDGNIDVNHNTRNLGSRNIVSYKTDKASTGLSDLIKSGSLYEKPKREVIFFDADSFFDMHNM